MKKFVIPLLIVIFLTDCHKSQDQVPNVPVDFYIYLTQPEYANLNVVGNWAYVTGGYKGIIVYHQSMGGITEFIAYDRTCPFELNLAGSIVEVDSSGLELIDRKCGSKFNILNGTVDHGPATAPLKQYAADYDGGSIVHIHN